MMFNQESQKRASEKIKTYDISLSQKNCKPLQKYNILFVKFDLIL